MLDSRFVLWVSLLLVLSFTGFSQARVINIPDDEETIQAGIDEAEDGDTVLVHPGTYVENINFEGKAITVGSLILTTGDEAYIDSTVIDGDRNGSSVVVFRNGEDENSVLTGFTIQNGETDYGGGIYCNNSSPTLSYLTIRNNEVDHSGGGMYCTTNASPDVSNVIVSGNIASSDDNDIVNCGGGISFYSNCRPTLNEIAIVDNEAEFGGGLMFSNGSFAIITNSSITRNSADGGGGIYDTGYTRFEHVIISDNEAEYEGGGIFCCDVHFKDVSIIGNRAGYGGGMMMSANYCTMINVNIAYNEAFQKGGGIYIEGSCDEHLIFTNVTFYGNLDVWQGDLAGGAIYCQNDYNNDINFNNCIFWGGEPCEIGVEVYNIVISYSDMAEGRDGIRGIGQFSVDWLDGNIDEDPLFVNPDEGDFHLTADSPCIDSGDPESDPDPDGTRADMGAFYFHQRDIDVNPDTLEFVGVQTGTTDTLVVIIRNVGLTPLQITSQAIEPEASSFAIVAGSGEVEIEPESDHLTWIAFTPEEQAEYRALFRIESNDPDEEIVEIQLFGTALSVDDDDNQPLEFGISGVYPNPFNSTATIRYELPRPSHISLSVYDLAGRLVETLVDERVDTGRYAKTWQAGSLPSGLYFVKMQASDKVFTRKVMLIR